jgi:hypothetical protein
MHWAAIQCITQGTSAVLCLSCSALKLRRVIYRGAYEIGREDERTWSGRQTQKLGVLATETVANRGIPGIANETRWD